MSTETGPTALESDAAFLRENVDIKYLKKTIDMGLVDSLLGEFDPTPTPSTPPTTKEEAEAAVMEPTEEKGILTRIKNFWSRTDKKIEGTDTKINNLNSLLKKAREVQMLKAEYEESISKKLGK